MIDYLLKSGGCLAIFYLFYVLFLEKENMHLYKRIYLITILLISFAIPFVTFTNYVEVVEVIQPIIASQSAIGIPLITEPETTSYTTEILWSIYGLGLLLFGFNFIKNLVRIIQKIRRNPNKKEDTTTSVLLIEDVVPHTFLNYIFYNKQKYITHQIPKEVVLHEQTHAKQQHSLDVLFIEFLQVLFWFNPFIFFIKKAIKLNHEFLADQAVITNGIQTQNYQKTLLAYSSHAYQLPLANAINYSSIKKRFTVMKTHTSKKKIWFRSLFLLPVFALLLFSFSTTVQQDKATPQQVAEYNKLAKKYNEQTNNDRVIILSELTRLKHLYDLMTPSQRAKSEKYPNIPPPPPPTAPGKKANNTHSYKENGVVKKIKYVDGKLPPPPPPIPDNATKEQVKKYEKTIKAYEKEVEKAHQELNRVDDFVHKGDISNIPPPPPPMSPVEFIKHNAKKGHTFYYEGKEISSKQAIEIARKNDAINLLAKDNKVTLSKEPITVETIDTIEQTSNMLPKNADYILDNKNVSYEEASKVNNNNIASVDVANRDGNGHRLEKPIIYIYTKKPKKVVDESERPITSINGIGCVECVLELTKEKLADVVLSVDKGDILKFNIKFPKKPTVKITNSTILNDQAKQFLDEAEVGQMVQIFGLKSSASKQHSPPVLFIITE
jgi:beta-lactamase regulating signal transducer with metallopeptidase domain